MDVLNNTYVLVSTISTTLLIVSELLGWSKCEAKSITQLYKCITCSTIPTPEPVTLLPVPTPQQLEGGDWSE